MPYDVTFEQNQLTDLVEHLERLQTYYAAEAAALSQAAMSRPYDVKFREYAAECIANRMELRHNAGELWAYLLEI